MEKTKVKKQNPTQKVSPKNLERVACIGKYGESFDAVLSRLLDYWETGKKGE